MFKNAPILFVFFIFINCKAFSQQETSSDSLCCSCVKYDTLEIKKVVKFQHLIKEIEPHYMQHLISLSENLNLIQFEKFNYLLKLDKVLKFELSKKLTSLENAKDSASLKMKLELQYLSEILKDKAKNLDYRIDVCNQKQEIKKYLQKKTIVNGLDPQYYSDFISLLNSTTDERKLNYEALITLEKGLLDRLELRKINLAAKQNKTTQEENDFIFLGELIQETNTRIATLEGDKNTVKIPVKELSVESEIAIPREYYLKQLIMNSDTIRFGSAKANEEEIIVTNNTMYIFKNGSLVETIKNEDTELSSIFDNRKPLSIDDFDGLFYTIQIGTYSKEVTVKELKVKSNLFYKNLPNGTIRYSYGMYNDLEEVEKAKKTLEGIGVTDIVVIAYHKKERITIKQAKKLKSNSLD